MSTTSPTPQPTSQPTTGPTNMATRAQLTQVVQQLHRDATLGDVWALRGGISAQMTALEVRLADGTTRKLIVRCPNARTLSRNPDAAADEFRILQLVQGLGVKTQTPYLLDTSGTILSTPYLVIEYIEGAPTYAPTDVNHYATQVAAQLARLHSTEDSTAHADIDLTFLPQQAPRLTRKLENRPAKLDDSLQEGRIRDVLEGVWPLPASRAPALLHGDFWPGNLLWQGDDLVAVIDWEDAEAGDALADVATTRLDLLWIMGEEAMQTFTQTYQALTHCDFALLPYWDLLAALRPMSQLDVWAADWPALGRSDITAATMRAGHHAFVERAFAGL